MLPTSFEMLARFTRSYHCFPKTLTSSSFAPLEPKTIQPVSFTGGSASGDGWWRSGSNFCLRITLVIGTLFLTGKFEDNDSVFDQLSIHEVDSLDRHRNRG